MFATSIDGGVSGERLRGKGRYGVYCR